MNSYLNGVTDGRAKLVEKGHPDRIKYAWALACLSHYLEVILGGGTFISIMYGLEHVLKFARYRTALLASPSSDTGTLSPKVSSWGFRPKELSLFHVTQLAIEEAMSWLCLLDLELQRLIGLRYPNHYGYCISATDRHNVMRLAHYLFAGTRGWPEVEILKLQDEAVGFAGAVNPPPGSMLAAVAKGFFPGPPTEQVIDLVPGVQSSQRDELSDISSRIARLAPSPSHHCIASVLGRVLRLLSSSQAGIALSRHPQTQKVLRRLENLSISNGYVFDFTGAEPVELDLVIPSPGTESQVSAVRLTERIKREWLLSDPLKELERSRPKGGFHGLDAYLKSREFTDLLSQLDELTLTGIIVDEHGVDYGSHPTPATEIEYAMSPPRLRDGHLSGSLAAGSGHPIGIDSQRENPLQD